MTNEVILVVGNSDDIGHIAGDVGGASPGEVTASSGHSLYIFSGQAFRAVGSFLCS